MNEYTRGQIQNKINKVLADANVSGGITHAYLNGALKESFISNLICPLLNNNYSVGSGKVTDYNGSNSKEIDILIYSNSILPPFFFNQDDKIKVYPIESVLKCIEIKSLLNKQALALTYEKCKFLEGNLLLTADTLMILTTPYHIFTQNINMKYFHLTALQKKY